MIAPAARTAPPARLVPGLSPADARGWVALAAPHEAPGVPGRPLADLLPAVGDQCRPQGLHGIELLGIPPVGRVLEHPAKRWRGSDRASLVGAWITSDRLEPRPAV